MARHYANFLESYFEFMRDNFCPDRFHFWTGVSIVAGALERKVWLPWSRSLTYYPNLYVLLVSQPAIGKSTAINPGVGMLREISQKLGSLRLLPSQVTEPQLLNLMKESEQAFNYGPTTHIHSSGYFFASEASTCLRDIWGPLLNTMTEFYDCNEYFEKSTKKEGTVTIKNACFNMLAGCTFDYLSRLISESPTGLSSIQGGFASRLLFVIQKETFDRQSPFQNRGVTKSTKVEYDKLMQDLCSIHKMVGPFSADAEFADNWEEWFPRADKERQNLKSEKLQALLGRKSTNLMKLCMIISAAESDDRILKKTHWERAVELLEDAEKDVPVMLRESKSRDTSTQQGLNSAIGKVLQEAAHNSMKKDELTQKLIWLGFNANSVKTTVDSFVTDNNDLRIIHGKDGVTVQLIGNPDDYL